MADMTTAIVLQRAPVVRDYGGYYPTDADLARVSGDMMEGWRAAREWLLTDVRAFPFGWDEPPIYASPVPRRMPYAALRDALWQYSDDWSQCQRVALSMVRDVRGPWRVWE